MTKAEVAKIMTVLQVAYPRYYAGQSEEEKRQAISLWHMMLEEHSYELVQQAVKSVIATNKFPPTVAEVIEKISFLKSSGGMTELEAWGYVSKAIRASTYRAQEEWEKLPEELQKIVSPDLLRSWAMVEGDDVETVLQSNFLRTFRVAQERQKTYAAVPKEVKIFMANIGSGSEDLLPETVKRGNGPRILPTPKYVPAPPKTR